MGLGTAGPGGVTLSDAQEKAGEARRQALSQGSDPIEARNGKLAKAKVANILF